MEQKEKILNTILQSIHKGCWMEIQYHNKQDIKKFFWIHIKYINFNDETFTCIGASLDDDKLNCKKLTLSVDRFISAKLLENTCFVDNKKIVEFLNEHIIETKKMFPSFDYGNILNYLVECAKKDSSEKIINCEMALGIDTEELKKYKEYKLNDKQFKEVKNIARECDELAINVLSIAYDNNKKFFLAYRYAKFNVEKRTLVMEEKTRPNKSLTSDKNITQFIYEDEEYLLDDFDNNIEEIVSLIKQRIKGKNYDIMQRSEIISIKNHFPLPIEEQLEGIKDMFRKDEVTHPIKSFFGEIESSRSKKVNSFCFVQNLNFSQIVSIFYGLKDHVSFVQGPPGTGKTSMVVNLVTSLFFNDKKVLVTTNNNQPMKDLTKKLNEISSYKDEAIELPICRLSAQDKMKDTIVQMNHLYNKYKKAPVKDDILKQNSFRQQHLLKDEVETLNKLAAYLEKNKRKSELLKFFENAKDKTQLISFETLFESSFQEKEAPIKNEKEFIDNITINKNLVKSFLYFNSAKYIQKLDLPRYKVLKNIIDIDINNTDAILKSIQDLINLLSNDEGVKLLLDIFPIVLSTNISASKLGSPKPHFDYCIIDEAAQCNITYSLISIIRGENLVLVGDPQQLKPVVTLSKIDNEDLKEKY